MDAYSFLILLLCLTTFSIRVLPRLLLPHALVTDTFFHLHLASLIREQRKLPSKLDRAVVKHRYGYPYLYHVMLALLPNDLRLWFERITGALFDTISTYLIYVVTCWALNANEHASAIALLCAALYSFSPALLRIGDGPRAYNGCARVLGQTVYLAHIFAAYWGLSAGATSGTVLAIVAGAVLFITSKFNFQAMVFFAPLLMLWNAWYPLLVLASFLLAVTTTGGKGWIVVRSSITHLVFYYKHLQKIFLYPHVLPWSWYRDQLRRMVADARQGNIKEAVQNFLTCRFWFHVLWTCFPQFLVFPAVLLVELPILQSELKQFLLAWMAGGLIWFLLTRTIKPLLFLGNGERYLEAAYYPAILLFVVLCYPAASFLVYGLLLYSVLAAAFHVPYYIKTYAVHDTNFTESKSIFEYLNSLPEGTVMPIGWVHWEALYRSNKPVFVLGSNFDPAASDQDEALLYYENYPYATAKYREVIDTYNVKYVLAERGCLSHYIANILRQDSADFLKKMVVIGESKNLILMRTAQSLQEQVHEVELLIASGMLVEAKQQLVDLLRFYPTDPTIYEALGNITSCLGASEALSYYQRMIALVPGSAEGQLGAAKCCFMLGQRREAAAHLQSLFRAYPAHEEGRRLEQLLQSSSETSAPSSI